MDRELTPKETAWWARQVRHAGAAEGMCGCGEKDGRKVRTGEGGQARGVAISRSV